MITCKEDLHGTFIDVTKDHYATRLFALTHDRGALFGREITKPYNQLPNGTPCVAIYIDSKGDWSKHSTQMSSSIRELTIADFYPSNHVEYIKSIEVNAEKVNSQWALVAELDKVYSKINTELADATEVNLRTKTEYTKVTDSIFDLRDDLESGRLYKLDICCDEEVYRKIVGEDPLITCLYFDDIYRKSDVVNLSYKSKENESNIKLKYVKTNYSRPSEAVRDLEDGAKFFSDNIGENEITDPCDLLIQMMESKVFIGVEVSWQEAFIDAINKGLSDSDSSRLHTAFECDQVTIDGHIDSSALLSAIHLVASMTDKPEVG